MAYIALYRKYRSQSFSELMGQDAVTTVLQNSLKSGRISHAYLFHGARGCGKTSTARLLSRALNCEAQDHPTPEPCGVCRICVSIRDGSCMDVVEIDAASETGVDNVREKIIENVQYVPTEARYKVYIIDEVHDLSAKAFDALLKTLEEPPQHVVFVLATTEQHKVPITIRSRCTQFQFKRGSLQDLSAAIQRVVDAEGYVAEPEAIRSMARCAEGSWRDALSVLEQVISYSDSSITEENVQRALGTVSSDTLVRVVDTVAHDDWSEILAAAADLIDSGKDVRQIITSLSGHLRELLLIAAGAKRTAQLELGEERVQSLAPQAAKFTPDTLLKMLSVLAQAEKETRISNQHRWLLERALCSLLPSNVRSVSLHKQEPAGIVEVQRVARTSPPAQARVESPVPEPQDIAQRPMPEQPMRRVPAANSAQQAQTPEAARRVVTESTDAEDRFVGPVDFDVISRSWQRIVRSIEKVSPSASSYLENATPCSLDRQTIVIAFENSFARDRILNKGKALVEKKINETLRTEGFKIRAQDEISNHVQPSRAADPAAVEPAAAKSMLEETLELFGGEVIEKDDTE